MLIVFALVSLLGGYFFYRRPALDISLSKKLLLGACRRVTIMIILTVLFNPLWRYNVTLRDKPKILILNDTSASMLLDDKAARYAQIKAKLIQQTDNYQLLTHNFAAGIDGPDYATLIQKSLLSIKDDTDNLTAIYLLSDGWFSDEDARFLSDYPVPIHTFGYTASDTQINTRIDAISHNPELYTDEISPLEIRLSSDDYTGKASLDFFVNDKKIKTETVSFAKTPSLLLLIEHKFKKPRLAKLSFRLHTNIDEKNMADNYFSKIIPVKKDKLILSFISDTINWDSAAILATFSANKRVKTDFYRLVNNNLYAKKEIVNMAKIIAESQMLVISNMGNLHFSAPAVRLITTYVHAGGGLLVTGEPLPELAELLGIKVNYVKRPFSGGLHLTSAARTYPSLDLLKKSLADIPPFNYHYVTPLPTAQVLASMDNQDNSPGLVYTQQVAGQVIYLPFTGLWKWRAWSDNGDYQTFVNDISQWLSNQANRLFAASTNKNSYVPGEEIKVILSVRDEKLQAQNNIAAVLTVRDSSGQVIRTQNFEKKNNRLEKIITKLPLGKYKYRATHQEQVSEGEFIISKNGMEAREYGINTPLLTYLASTTNGQYYNEQANNIIPKAVVKTRRLSQEIPLYKKWWLIALFITCFSFELFMRKRLGLL